LIFEHPLGIGCSTETIHTVLDYIRMKVFGGGQFLNADFGRRMVGKEMYRIEIGCLFLCSFLLGKQKKGECG